MWRPARPIFYACHTHLRVIIIFKTPKFFQPMQGKSYGHTAL